MNQLALFTAYNGKVSIIILQIEVVARFIQLITKL